MKFELRSNGRVEMEIYPESVIEAAFIEAFTLAGTRGQVASICEVTANKEMPIGVSRAGLVISVEK